MNHRKIAFVSDFDGTITEDDFFSYTADAYFDEKALAPWREYRAGRKTHFEALKEMFVQIHVSEGELHALIDRIRVDPDLDSVWRQCRDKGISLYVCSAGNDYYIRRILGDRLKKYDVTLVANKGAYAPETGLVMTAPDREYPFYDVDVGISKYRLVRKLKDEGRFVLFAGDGPPDFEPAKAADVVFARKILLDECRKAGLETKRFDGFKDIGNYIREL